MITAGQEVPSAKVARLEGDLPVAYDIRDLLKGRRTLLVGAPQAFTPVCSQRHIPGIIEALEDLKSAGFDQIIIIAPDNPWAMAVWQEHFPGAKDFLFLSDGNEEFLSACGLKETCAGLFLGQCSKRYALQLDGVVVRDVSVEESILVVKCTDGRRQAQSAPFLDEDALIEIV